MSHFDNAENQKSQLSNFNKRS